MTTSLFARKGVLCWSLAAAISAVFLFQSAAQPFTSFLGEYQPAGSLKGNEVFPAVALAPDGGWLAYQSDIGGNSSIYAVGLDPSLKATSSPFRVNLKDFGAQTHVQVALLAGGNAVFVWQAGPPSHTHIKARFLSATNTWLTQDVSVNTFRGTFQTDPAVAALGNGNVVIVWSSYNQVNSTSRLDVYGQIFTPEGYKVGSEFLVNQFTDNNQRSPTVAAWPGGGFAVAWVSERLPQTTTVGPLAAAELPRPRADIYWRPFNADGTTTYNEASVNVDSDTCANPRLAVGSDGGFMVVWSQKDNLVPSNSWDVFSRTYASDGTTITNRIVNTRLYGDQYAPQVSAVGTNYLVVWTSLGQDGSREGVYGQFLAGDGTLQGGEFRVNTTTVGRQMQQAVASDGSARFLAVWSGYVAGQIKFNIFGQQYAAPDFAVPQAVAAYTPPPDPSEGNPLYADSSAEVNPAGYTNAPPPFSYPVDVTSSGSTNFLLVQGLYNGLFYDTNKLTVTSSGYLTVSVKGQRFTARVYLQGRAYAFAGAFNAQGFATCTIAPRGLTPMVLQLQLDLSGGDQLHGTLGGGFSAVVLADRQVYTKALRAGQTGLYTFVIPADTWSPNGPDGVGFGAARIDALGNVFFTGLLADGTPVSQRTTLSREGVWPLYCSLYGGSGSLLGWIQLGQDVESDLSGQVVWTKPAGVARAKYYTGGFTNSVVAKGSIYTLPTASQPRVLGYGDGTITFYGGGLTNSFTNSFNLDLRDRVTVPKGSSLRLGFTLSNGLFKGSTLNPQTGKLMTFQGALFQKKNTGTGYFLGASDGGGLYLSPAP